ncbi:acyl-CoA dehydrogenase family protein [Micromonospora sp. NPDC049101]|uniref:acyl-CoA dehydrogenase family protein n=1 Tax=Micromonospora sp. NPDC049101 TaxID=3155032 RepID=UPI0033C7636E
MTAVESGPVRTADPVDARVLLERARDIGAETAGRGAEIEAAGTLPTDLVERLRAARLFAMGLPRDLGGVQAPLTTIVEVIAELARADASTAWATLVGNTSVFLSWLEPDAARAATAGGRDPIVAGSMAPTGRGEPVGDGFRVNGRWAFVSGSRHADWYMGGMTVVDQRRSGPPELRTAFFRPADVTVDPTWDVIGLCGTGSNDVLVSDTVVPARHTAAPHTGPASFDTPLTRLTPYNILMVLFAGVPLGVARRALDELTGLAATKRRAGSTERLLDDPAVGDFVIGAEPALRAARLVVLDVLHRTEARLGAGAELDPTERAQVAAAGMHAMRVGWEVTLGASRLAGTGATARDSALQRFLRDLAAARQHIAFGPDLRVRTARSLLGAPSAPALFGV